MTTLPVGAIIPNPDQPRKTFEKTSMAELVESIRAMGIVEPLVVRPLELREVRRGPEDVDCDMVAGPGFILPRAKAPAYMLIAGERRWRAAQEAGLTEVPVVIREDLDERAAFLVSMVENVLRKDMTAIEEAKGYQTLLDQGMTIEDISRATGVSVGSVKTALSLLTLDVPIQELVHKGGLSAWDGSRLATLGINGQHTALRVIQTQGLTGNDRDRVIGQVWLAENQPSVFAADEPQRVDRKERAELHDALLAAADAVARAYRIAGRGQRGNIVEVTMDQQDIDLVNILASEVARLARCAKLSTAKALVQEELLIPA